jgi:glyoxylase-like metal-dependent hydrolase (beta-lactamase superfamily II)
VVAHEFLTGVCIQWGALINAPRQWGPLRFPARAWAFERPDGVVVLDTGYAPRVLDAARTWPYRAYRYAAPMEIGEDLVSGLERHGVAADDVRTLIVSHLHADHIGGLRDFGRARLVLSRDALHTARLRGARAVQHGLLPALLPDDLEHRARLVEDLPAGPRLGPFGTHDLFGDGDFLLIGLPGHARGQVGLRVEGELFVADAVFGVSGLDRPPGLGDLVIAADRIALRRTRARLRLLRDQQPAIRIVASHETAVSHLHT